MNAVKNMMQKMKKKGAGGGGGGMYEMNKKMEKSEKRIAKQG